MRSGPSRSRGPYCESFAAGPGQAVLTFHQFLTPEINFRLKPPGGGGGDNTGHCALGREKGDN